MPIPGSTQRAPATPLVVHDPTFSLWSFADNLTDGNPRHWTGSHRGARAVVRIDGVVYRILGEPWGPSRQPMKQLSCEVFPTRTVFKFEAAGIELTLSFISPLLPDDLDVLSRPVTYVENTVRSIDGKTHQVEVYHEWGAEAATDTLDQAVAFQDGLIGGLHVARVGTTTQPVLGAIGDNLRTDWGFFALAAGEDAEVAVSGRSTHLERFAKTGSLAGQDPAVAFETNLKPINEVWQRLATARSLGAVSAAPKSFVYLMAWDDGFCLEFLNERLLPYWQREGKPFLTMLTEAYATYGELKRRCEAFDEKLLADCQAAGGSEYKDLCALAYRQAVGAHKLAQTRDGLVCFLSKENFSNGCIATVDVTYPSAPLFLLTNPALLKGMLDPILVYARSGRWKFPFAPHDLGTYPKANGQVYGGGERTADDQMPVEESGNLLLLVAGVVKATGDASYADKAWDLLAVWAAYLAEKGLDPENQLCTDDFAGHLAHNANLSLKAILALGAYAWLAKLTGRGDEAQRYRAVAESMAAQWQTMAADGDHTRLVFDQAGTWSQKYNLVWDDLLGLGLFPAELARREVAFYLTKQNPYGLPLDNRSDYTKLDWTIWCACLGDDKSFRALVAPLHRWLAETKTRVPMTDWYWTTAGDQVGFQARSVVGGVFLRTLQAQLKKG